MKARSGRAAKAHRNERDLVGAELEVESLLLQFGCCRSALVQYGEGRSVNEKSNNCNALLFAKTEMVQSGAAAPMHPTARECDRQSAMRVKAATHFCHEDSTGT